MARRTDQVRRKITLNATWQNEYEHTGTTGMKAKSICVGKTLQNQLALTVIRPEKSFGFLPCWCLSFLVCFGHTYSSSYHPRCVRTHSESSPSLHAARKFNLVLWKTFAPNNRQTLCNLPPTVGATTIYTIHKGIADCRCHISHFQSLKETPAGFRWTAVFRTHKVGFLLSRNGTFIHANGEAVRMLPYDVFGYERNVWLVR